MAHHISAEKRNRQSKRRQAYNRYYKIMAKRAIREVKIATTVEEATAKLSAATKILQRVACAGVVHKNYASNNISAMQLHVNKLKAQAA